MTGDNANSNDKAIRITVDMINQLYGTDMDWEEIRYR
jgi:hypothetical protein